MIGGLGKDELRGGSEDDLLVAGPVTFETNLAALEAVPREWTRTDQSYLQRVFHLCHGGGLNGATRLDSATVTADAAANKLTGAAGRDWFWANLIGPPTDIITDRDGPELVGCPTFFVVTTTRSGSPGTLRQAILDANANPGNDVIFFDIDAAGVQTIRPTSALPDVTDPVIIDSYTQLGSSPNTLAVGNDAIHLIELDGSVAGAANGLHLTAGYSMVRGLDINRFALNGISLEGPGWNVVEGNFIGTDVSGTMDLGNLNDGISVVGSSRNLIGGSTPAARNVISGNGRVGVNVQDDAGSVIRQNYIVTDANGQFAVSNSSHGVVVQGFSNGTTILDNVVSGNGVDGLTIGGMAIVVQGNTIGLNAAGDVALPNASYGITFGARDGVIGGTSAAERNLISGNAGGGIRLLGTATQVLGNFIGTERSGTAAQGNGGVGIVVDAGTDNTIRDNLISANLLDDVRLQGGHATDNEVAGNDIRGNLGAGVFVHFGANHNTIGGALAHPRRGENPHRNLISGNSAGVVISGAGTDENLVEGNYIGTDVLGTGALSNFGAGVRIEAGARFNRIGGTAFRAGNLISGNGGSGIAVSGVGTDDNRILGNTIGTDAFGTAALANGGNGVQIGEAARTWVGGAFPDWAANLISGNAGNGIEITGAAARNNLVQANYIGTDATGAGALGNGGDGVLIVNASFNYVGLEDQQNIISGNFGDGVEIRGSEAHDNGVQGNYIGTDFTGLTALGNRQDGVLINGAHNNFIGGLEFFEPDLVDNVISGNLHNGIEVRGPTAAGNFLGGGSGAVITNLVGTNRFGSVALPNQRNGVLVTQQAHHNVLGGSVISGNIQDGVHIEDAGAMGNGVFSSRIGGTLAGLPLPNRGHGVFIDGAPGNTIGSSLNGNWIASNRFTGVTITGSGAAGNAVKSNVIQANGLTGVKVVDAPNTTIGGTTFGVPEGNVIAGNHGTGVVLQSEGATGNLVQGNRITSNQISGVEFVNASNNLVGGTTSEAHNVISGNTVVGIRIVGIDASGNRLEGNYIGTDAAGAVLGNGASGVFLGSGTHGNLIGGAAAAGNIIVFNGADGIELDGPSRKHPETATGIGNGILSNSIYANGGLGIDLGADGVTLNDMPFDPDTGPNNLQNFPDLSFASTDLFSTTVVGKLESTKKSTFTLQFFFSPESDPSGFGEGKKFLGSWTVTTTAGGVVHFTAHLSRPSAAGGFVTATATDASYNTSEFSKRQVVRGLAGGLSLVAALPIDLGGAVNVTGHSGATPQTLVRVSTVGSAPPATGDPASAAPRRFADLGEKDPPALWRAFDAPVQATSVARPWWLDDSFFDVLALSKVDVS